MFPVVEDYVQDRCDIRRWDKNEVVPAVLKVVEFTDIGLDFHYVDVHA